MAERLQLQQLHVGYGGADIIKDVSFSMASGQLCALLGSNGSGKSTLLRGICALLPTRGIIRLDGVSLDRLSRRQRARAMGYLAQRSSLTLALTALEVVLMGFNPLLGLLQAPSQEHRLRALALLDWVGAGAYAQQEFATLSEGQKQLTLLARTLVCQPKLVVLDEPDSALDFCNRQQILVLLTQYCQTQGGGVLLCSHDVNTALAHAQQLLLLKDGRLIHDLHLPTVSHAVLERALQECYGRVELLRHGGRYVMIGGVQG